LRKLSTRLRVKVITDIGHSTHAQRSHLV
jgi:hypothetical protein